MESQNVDKLHMNIYNAQYCAGYSHSKNDIESGSSVYTMIRTLLTNHVPYLLN